MTAPTIEVEIVEDGSAAGTLKYLVAETNREPWIAQNIHEMLEEVEDFDATDVHLLMPDLQLVPVSVTVNLHDEDDWSVRLGFEPEYGHLVEHVVYAEGPAGLDGGHETQVHTQYVNGWPTPVS